MLVSSDIADVFCSNDSTAIHLCKAQRRNTQSLALRMHLRHLALPKLTSGCLFSDGDYVHQFESVFAMDLCHNALCFGAHEK